MKIIDSIMRRRGKGDEKTGKGVARDEERNKSIITTQKRVMRIKRERENKISRIKAGKNKCGSKMEK